MKIITALNNEKINEELKKEKGIEIIDSDIQYQDGVFEILEEEKKYDILIISENIITNGNFQEFIEKIINKKRFKKIIICLKKKDEEKELFLSKNNIKDIIINNKNLYDEIRKLLGLKINKEKGNKIFNKTIKNKNKEKLNKKIINVLGAPGCGKTIFLIIFSLIIKNKKILIINFYNNELKNIFNYKKFKKNKYLIKINKNIFLLINAERIINENNIKDFITEKQKEFNYIIFDSSKIELNNINKKIIENSDLNILLIEPNILELKKTRNLLNNYINIWKIKKEKINIIFNKINIFSINNNILNYLFSEFKILGKIKYNKNYNLIINSNLKIIPIQIKKEYKKIINKI